MLNQVSKESIDLTQQNIEKLKELFPEILTDGNKIDFEMLQTILGEQVDGEKERYSFTWPGKRAAIIGTQQPSKGTLRPNKEKSKNFDTTENLYIEGDNLEVLKLLQKSYNNKIKVIYIDPPYNTGKDFVYKDNFRDGIENYLEQTGQVDSDGNLLSTNSESNGRFHTDWLNMMYPRLKLARNLMSDDGIIFISIDDNEQDKMRKICDEIFGEINRLSTHNIKVRYDNKSLNERNDWQPVMEYIFIYAKNKSLFSANKPSQPYSIKGFTDEIIEHGSGETVLIDGKKVEIFKKGEWERVVHSEAELAYLKPTWITGSIYSGTGHGTVYQKVVEPRYELDGYGSLYKIYGLGEDGLGYRYMRNPQSEKYSKGEMFSGVPLQRLKEIESGDAIKYSPITNFYDFSPDFGNIRHEGGVSFNSGKKPIKLLKQLINYHLDKDSIVLDFFSGSSSTAHAVMSLNSEDNGNRKYIMVQLPELLDNSIQINGKKLETISDVGAERIRISGEKIIFENPVLNNRIDTGFKYLTLDKSNIKEWNTDFETIEDEIDLFAEVFVENRSELDVVYEIMLKNGLELTLPVNTFEVDGKKVYDIAFGLPFICLADNIDTAIAKAIIDKRDEYGMDTISGVVFKDAGFKGNDSEKLNCIQLLKDAGFIEENLQTI